MYKCVATVRVVNTRMHASLHNAAFFMFCLFFYPNKMKPYGGQDDATQQHHLRVFACEAAWREETSEVRS